MLRFLQQYFQLYDGDMREQLLEAYHEDAVMSMSVAYPYYDTQEVRACNNLKRYLSVGSRNLVIMSLLRPPQFQADFGCIKEFHRTQSILTQKWLRSQHMNKKYLTQKCSEIIYS